MILEPGLEHFIDISAYTATTDKSAEALDVKYREVSGKFIFRNLHVFQGVLHKGGG